MEYLLSEWIQPIIMVVLGAALGWLATAYHNKKQESSEREKEAEASLDLIKCIARIYLVEFYDRFVVNNEPMSLERWEEVDKLYKAYKALGGNGTGDKLYAKLAAKVPYIVNETTTTERK